MSGGEKLGSLYFDLGLDDKTFESVFNATMKKYDNKFNIKIGIDASGITATQKQINELLSVSTKPMTQYSAGKLELLSAESAEKQRLSQQKIATEVERTALAHKKLESAGSQSQSRIRSNTEWANKTLLSQRQLAIQLSNQFGTMFSIYAVERFVKKLMDVRGEFELQKVSLRAILQDAPAADAIFEKIKQLSVQSPFTFKDLVGYTKQLAAFSIPVNELYDTMKNLADVSAGLGVDMGRITLAFGQVRAASVLRGQELRQFTEAGIPLVEELAKKFTKLTGVVTSNGDVFDKISKRMVSFEMVKEIFDDMTSAGGKFYNMQELQASTLKGMLSNLTDAFDIALNNIGETNEGVLKGAVSLTTDLIRNWETVGKAMVSIIATYGAYNLAMAVNTAITKINTETGIYNISTRKLSKLAMIEEMWAQSALNKVLLANPYGALFTVAVALAGAVWTLSDSTSSYEKAQERVNQLNEEQKKQNEDLKSTTDSLIGVITSETDTIYSKIKAFNRLKELYPEFIKNMDYHAIAAMNAEDRQKLLNKAMDEMNFSSSEDKLNSFKKVLSDINSGEIKATDRAAELLGYGFWKTISTDAEQYPAIIKDVIDQLEKQKKIELEIKEEAKFDALPQEEKVKIWEKQIKQLEDVKAGLIGAAKNADYLGTALVKPKDTWDLMAKTDVFEISLNSMYFLNKGIGDLKDKISGKDIVQNEDKKFWEDKLKAAKESWESLTKSEILSKTPASIAAKKSIKEAEDALKTWDLSTKSQKKAEDAAAKALEIKIKLLKESYEIYKKLSEFQGKDQAKETINTDPRFARYKNLPGGSAIPTSTSELAASISPIIAAANQRSAGVQKAARENKKLIEEGYVEGTKEGVDRLLKTLEQAISDYKPKYDLYEKLLNLTGDSKQASLLAFGREFSVDLETFMREQYAKIPDSGFYSELTKPADGASDAVKKAWNELTEYIQSKKIGKIEYFQDLISQSLSTSEKIKVIELKRERDILDAKKAFAKDPAQMESAINAIKLTSEQQINEIRSQLFQLTPLYNEVFKDLGKVAAGNLDDLLAKTNGLLNLVKTKGEVKKGVNGETTGYFLKAGTVDVNSGLKIEKDTLVSVEKYNDLIERVNAIVNKINENPFKALFNPPKGATTETIEEKAKRISTALQGISDLANSVSGDIGNIMDSFGASSESQSALKNITQVATGAGEAGVGVARLASGDIVGGIKSLVGGISKVITGLNAMHDAKYEKQIKEYQKQIDATVKSYDALTDALSRKTAASKIDAQAEEYNLLQREKNLLEAQKRAEESKKKSDQSKINDYNKQIEDAAKKQQELALNTISYVLGGNIGSQADSWAKTLTDAMDTAFQNGTDAAKAWGDSVNSIVRDIAKNFIVNSFLGKQLQGWLESASSDWTNADKTINQKNIEDDLKGFSVFAKSLEPATEAALKALNAIYGNGTSASASSNTLANNIKGVTEDTAQRLASMINAIRQDSGVSRMSLDSIKNILSSALGVNTEATSYLRRMDENISQMNMTTKSILKAIDDVTTIGSSGKSLRIV